MRQGPKGTFGPHSPADLGPLAKQVFGRVLWSMNQTVAHRRRPSISFPDPLIGNIWLFCRNPWRQQLYEIASSLAIRRFTDCTLPPDTATLPDLSNNCRPFTSPEQPPNHIPQKSCAHYSVWRGVFLQRQLPTNKGWAP